MRLAAAVAGGVAVAVALAACGTGGISKGSADVQNGKRLFLGKGQCAGCHTLAAAGSTGTIGPNLDDEHPDAGKVREMVNKGEPPMPSFRGTLTPEQIDLIAKFVAQAVGRN